MHLLHVEVRPWYRVRRAGVWRVYAQIHTRVQANILRVDEIFEG